MRNRLIKRRGFNKLESRVFCPCELCRLRFGVMLYNRFRGGEPLRSYRPGGFLHKRRRAQSFAAMRAARRGELVTVGSPEQLLTELNAPDPEEARRQGNLVAATYKDDEDVALWLDNAERGLDEDWEAIGEDIAQRYPKTLDRLKDDAL